MVFNFLKKYLFGFCLVFVVGAKVFLKNTGLIQRKTFKNRVKEGNFLLIFEVAMPVGNSIGS